MILILYRLAAEVVLWIAVAGEPCWPKRWRVAERLGKGGSTGARGKRKTIWLHAASLGECKGLWSLAKRLEGLDADLLLTTNTAAGLDFLRAEIGKDPARAHACVAPLDHPRVARRFLEARAVRALVVFEVELWPHWFLAARRAGVPVSWVSARWNARARRRYGWFPAAARRVLQRVAWAQAQSEGDADALRRAGCARVEIGGDLRGLQYLDGADADTTRARQERAGTAFVSFHAEELPALVTMLLAEQKSARGESPQIVFPRKSGEMAAFVKALAPLGFAAHSENPRAPRRVVDGFGLVTRTLRDVRFAVVGGSFARDDRIGGHNLWEPLLAGCRVAVGPRHENQAWLAERMRAAGVLRVVRAGSERSSEWTAFLAEDDALPERDRGAKVAEEARATLLASVRAIREHLST